MLNPISVRTGVRQFPSEKGKTLLSGQEYQ